MYTHNIQPVDRVSAPDRPGKGGAVRRVPQSEQPQAARAAREIARETADQRKLAVIRLIVQKRVLAFGFAVALIADLLLPPALLLPCKI